MSNGKWDATKIVVVVHLLNLWRFGKNASSKKKDKARIIRIRYIFNIRYGGF